MVAELAFLCEFKYTRENCQRLPLITPFQCLTIHSTFPNVTGRTYKFPFGYVVHNGNSFHDFIAFHTKQVISVENFFGCVHYFQSYQQLVCLYWSESLSYFDSINGLQPWYPTYIYFFVIACSTTSYKISNIF